MLRSGAAEWIGDFELHWGIVFGLADFAVVFAFCGFVGGWVL